MPKKIERGDPLVSSGFVGYVKIVKKRKGDPFALISADRTWPYGSNFRSSDCKKSGPIRVRLSSDEKKTDHCNSRALFTGKVPTKNSHCYSRAFFPQRKKRRVKNSHCYSRTFFPQRKSAD